MFKRSVLVLLAVSLFSFGTVGTSLAASHMAKPDKLVVKITTTSGTTWGRVSVDWKAAGKTFMYTCRKKKCVYHPAHMVKLHLSEVASSPSTWPFAGWSIDNSGHMSTKKKHKFSFEIMKSKAVIGANYVLK
ncbi:MAG TPA: hypothetical protein VFB34_00760 [Chloroflexota bacterium]|nr:hypothetical protein [Chloroflexota bacterium]